MAKKHNLKMGAGTITDNEDGTASYRQFGKLTDSFRVTIADVVTITEALKNRQRTVQLIGTGGEIASTNVGLGVAPKIEEWFRAHPDFGKNATSAAAPPGAGSLADELAKLAGLRDAGVLTPAEFDQQKARLLG